MLKFIENLYEMANMEVEQNLVKWRESMERMFDSSEIEDYISYKNHFDQCLYWERKYLESIKEREKYSIILKRLGA